jgi:hypothetical protein
LFVLSIFCNVAYGNLAVAQTGIEQPANFDEVQQAKIDADKIQMENQQRFQEAIAKQEDGKMFYQKCDPKTKLCEFGWKSPPDATIPITNQRTNETRLVDINCKDGTYWNNNTLNCEYTEETIMYQSIEILFGSIGLGVGIVYVLTRPKVKAMIRLWKEKDD